MYINICYTNYTFGGQMKKYNSLIAIICLFLALIILGYTYLGKETSSNKSQQKELVGKNIRKVLPKTVKNDVATKKADVVELRSDKINFVPVQNTKSANNDSVYKLQVKDFKYQNHVLYSIKRNWYSVSKDTGADFSMLIKVGKNGTILSYGILQESQNKDFQQKAIKAVLESVPYQKFENAQDVTYQVIFRGNDVRIGFYNTGAELPYIVNYKKLLKTPYRMEETKVERTVGSAPGKLAYKMPDSMQILRNWTPPLDAQSKVNLEFDITKDGNPVNIKVVSSSGSDMALYEAKKALIKTKFKDVSEYMGGVKFWFEVADYNW